jgi:hypothetical protein
VSEGRWYPKRDTFFAALTPQRPIFPLQHLALQEAHQHPDYEHLADELYSGESE